MNVGVWAVVVLVVEVETTMVVGGEVMAVIVVGGGVVMVVVVMGGGVLVFVGSLLVVVVDMVAVWHPTIEVIKNKLTTILRKPEYLLFIASKRWDVISRLYAVSYFPHIELYAYSSSIREYVV